MCSFFRYFVLYVVRSLCMSFFLSVCRSLVVYLVRYSSLVISLVVSFVSSIGLPLVPYVVISLFHSFRFSVFRYVCYVCISLVRDVFRSVVLYVLVRSLVI